MNTAIVSGSVSGNIGSCKTEISTIVSGRTFFVENLKNYATNSCTGSTETFETWRVHKDVVDYSFALFLGLAIVALVWGIIREVRESK